MGAIKAGDLSGLVTEMRTWSDAFSRERSDYLVEVVISELRTLWNNFEHLDRSHQEYLDRDWPALFLDAEQKARATRGRDRIERIGKIVGGAASSQRPPDEIEEFMRVAMSLDDRDVLVLRILNDHQAKMLRPEFARVRGYDAYSTWNAVCAETGRVGILRGELDAICGKLESFGFVTRGERHSNLIGDEPTPFALLLRGSTFLKLAQSSSRSQEAS